MSVDLSDQLIESIKGEVNPPGTDLFPNATDDEWLGQLQNSFWEAKMYGFFKNYSEIDGIVSPITGTVELPREQQQLIILFASARIVRNELKNTNTVFSAKAGPVEFEVQNSAQLLVAILNDVRARIDLALRVLGILNATTVTYIDALVGRQESLYYGDTYFWSN